VIGETAEIGDDVTLYHGVTLGGTSWSPGKRHPTVESDALIGAGAKILGPIVVCAGARVGANSVVVEDVPPGMTVVGIPGRVVRDRRRRQRFDGRIDLEHHLIPDPVGDALARMLDRIEFLEARVTHLQGRGAGQPAGVPGMAPANATAEDSNSEQKTISGPLFNAAMEILRT
jgi:serine O-acetyltransferase